MSKDRAETIAALRSQMRGELVEPSHPNYDATRVIWNGIIDRKPALIARCLNAGDVALAVCFARDNGLVIAIRAGGHNVAGYAVCDGGLMIDLSLMNGVRVSADLRSADVGGGAIWGDVDAATTAFDRATPGGLISDTGVAGLTLSGGIGWLRGSHGLSCDNLIAADVVTADGKLVRASENENADLFWALRGGGGNFGVVVNFQFRLHTIEPELMFCAPAYPEERADEIIPLWREFMKSAPDKLSGLVEFSTIQSDPSIPEHAWGRRVIALAHVYDGLADEGEKLVQPLRNFGEPLVDFSGRMSYRAIQSAYDALFPKGKYRCYWKATYIKSLDENVVHDITSLMTLRPSELTISSIWKFGGAVQKIAADATAFGDRSMPFMVSFDGVWADAANDKANIDWARSSWNAMQKHSTGRMYLNFPGHGEGANLVRDAFGAEPYARLQKVKRKYDPTNLFHLNQNILPN